MPKKRKNLTKHEKKELDEKAKWGCVVCRKIDINCITPAQIHHITKNVGLSQRGEQTIPLCYYHHMSPKYGIHGMGVKAWTKIYGTEHELLEFYEAHKSE